MTNAIAIAADAAGGQAALARSVGVQPALVWQWVAGRRPVAAHHCLAIERATGVSVHTLRPDVFGTQEDGLAPPGAPAPASGVTKRALRARLGLQSDAHLAVVLKLPAGEVARWPEEGALPALPQVVALLGTQQPAAPAPPADPDDDRIVAVDTA